MKTKKIHKKLFLNKETIVNLLQYEMHRIKAGDYAAASAAPIGETTCADSYCPILTCTCQTEIEPVLIP